MTQYKMTKSTCLLSCLVSSCLVVWVGNITTANAAVDVIAQTTSVPQSISSPIASPIASPISSQKPTLDTSSAFRNLLRRIFPDDERDDPTTISRSDLCLLAPARTGEETTIWHQRPIFIWQGTIGKLEVVDEATGDLLWQYEPTPEETFVSYGGDRLTPGDTYLWRVYDSAASENPIAFPPFTILPAINRLLIANGLSVAQERAIAEANEQENPPELARANYFAFRELPVDALQSLFTVEDPSLDLVEGRAAVVESMCD